MIRKVKIYVLRNFSNNLQKERDIIVKDYKETRQKYDEKNMKRYSVNMPLTLHNEMMTEVEKQQTNRNAYTIQAIREKLENDKNKDI